MPFFDLTTTPDKATGKSNVTVFINGSSISILEQNGIIESYEVNLTCENTRKLMKLVDVDNHEVGTYPSDGNIIFSNLQPFTNCSATIIVKNKNGARGVRSEPSLAKWKMSASNSERKYLSFFFSTVYSWCSRHAMYLSGMFFPIVLYKLGTHLLLLFRPILLFHHLLTEFSILLEETEQ